MSVINKSEFKDDIKFLKNQSVFHWVLGNTEFLDKSLQTYENEWGKSIMKTICGKNCNVQWTNDFGESIGYELMMLWDKNKPKHPLKKKSLKPDFESTNYIIEVKTQTYYTSGTAGEKILGVPFKYAAAPKLFEKPLIIVCVGGAEKLSRESYGVLSDLDEFADMPKSKIIEEEQKMLLEHYSKIKITYKSACEIIRELLS